MLEINYYKKVKNLFKKIYKKDLNPIEWVWNDLKYFLCTGIHPQYNNELINGIE